MTDHSAAVKVVTCFLLIVSFIAVVACLTTNWQVLRRKVSSVTLLLSTLIASIASGAAVSVAATHGLGQASPLSDDQVVVMQKALYSMEVLYVLTLGLGKLSVMVLFYSLLSSTGQSKSVLAATGLLLIWVVVMAIVVCLQCHPPEVWNIVGGKCLDVSGIWIAFGVMNVLVEIMIIAVPSFIIFRLQLSLKRRLVVISCFGIRILDIAGSIVQLCYVRNFKLHADSPLPTNVWQWAICSQVLQTVAILSACVPYLREFLESFPSGMFKPTELKHPTVQSAYNATKCSDSDIELMRPESTKDT
ncbi:hypothetical protein AtubIFM55763_009605 [Aspergillus tubingensis]|uniref:Uncharacterized protein n=1 Tax=Aspergillus costaricaensis CBS 115574 TaxID=1448317 RepID=A0ACD1ISB2_9EURO|nr:hypothetical protein BO79DRAFT_185730 [Aspergillus costaricaensis CBS 115574]XP_035351478.1 putative integral membrane protein [Aspergillus tubingensis]RAK93369.1 hypothetical protein BO79DRAFT_185730 [Aspergillus costaricaensis CBS 115574]GFN10674.1 putative integral membrane protein [Aspergillus tubingensis]GLA77419.1 hypothetical protein AtubIFM55763_009605 [Aspergillus tubingensis]GLB02685.1 hypothetical protein AtubIFM57258_006144 [Aspergillus tubingensis]GLB22534.1 hypothetical prote